MISAILFGLLILPATYGASASVPRGPQRNTGSNIEFPINAQFSALKLQLDAPDLGERHQLAADTMFEVAVKLKTLLEEIHGDKDRTFLLSPLSIVSALGQILLGAHGDTRMALQRFLTTNKELAPGGQSQTTLALHQQMSTLIHTLQTELTTKGSTEYILHIASAIFIDKELKLKPKFSEAIANFYDTTILPVDFRGNPAGTLKTINEWADYNTRGLVKSVLSSPLPPSAGSVLLNAIYFRGSWETPFSPDVTYKDKFHTRTNEHVMVDFMRGQFEIPYVNSTRFKCSMIILPYKHSEYAMYVMLPHRLPGNSIQSFTKTLTSDVVDEIIKSTKSRQVTLALPKMFITQRFSLRQPLIHFQKNLGKPITQRSGGEFGIYPKPTNRVTDYKEMTERASTFYQPPVYQYVRPLCTSCSLYQTMGRNARSIMKEEEKERIDDYHEESEKDVEKQTPLQINNKTLVGDTSDKQENKDKHDNENVQIVLVNKLPVINSPLEDALFRNKTNVTEQASENMKVDDVNKKTPSLFHINEDGDIQEGNASSEMHGNVEAVNSTSSSSSEEDGMVTPVEGDHPQSMELTDRIEGDNEDGGRLNLDLSGASSDPRFRVDDIVHQVVLEVTETGTEAAAITSTFVDYSLSGKNFIVNRPYIFFIRHQATRSTLFWGSILNPIDDVLQDI